MKHLRLFITLAALLAVLPLMAATPAASTVLDKMDKALTAKPSISADFKIADSANAPVPGHIIIEKNCFALTTKGAQASWYDGSTLYTYNPAVEEINITTPTTDELAMVNPLAIIAGLRKEFTARQLKAPAGKYIIQLSPKQNKSDISTLTLTINSTTYLPERALITLRNGQKASIAISNIKAGQHQPKSRFVPSKTAYPKAEYIDLR